MSNYVDLSSFNPDPNVINWPEYVAWSKTGDGISRLALRVGQGVGVPDTKFAAYFDAAKGAGIEHFIFYWFVYPWLHPGWSGAQSEVESFLSTLGTRLGANDLLMCDAEEYQGNVGPADWHWDFLHLTSELGHVAPARCPMYSYPDYIVRQLQDPRLAQFPLILADYGPTVAPPAPKPWGSLMAWQKTSKGVVPGIPGAVDVDLWEMAAAPPPKPTPNVAQAIADLKAALAALGG